MRGMRARDAGTRTGRHRATGGTGAVLAAALLLTGCAGAADARAPGEVVDAADCVVQEVFGAASAPDGVPVGPRAGGVPSGFRPVAVVECRAVLEVVDAPPVDVEVLDPGATPGEDPGVTGEDPGVPSEDAPADDTGTPPGAVVEVVRREGGLPRLLRHLARADVAPRPDQACMLMYETRPVIYLVDADGRAVRAQWPTDACGFLLDGARETLAGVREVATERVVVG